MNVGTRVENSAAVLPHPAFSRREREKGSQHRVLLGVALTMNTSHRDRNWVIAQSLLMLAVVILGVTHRGAWHSEAGFAAGVILFALGAVAGIWGLRVLGRSRTPFPTPRPDAELVQSGIYRRIRHPLYSSVMLASLGWAFLWQSAAALAATAVLFVFFDAKARLEERLLLAKFPEYEAYRGRTWRFIPWLY